MKRLVIVILVITSLSVYGQRYENDSVISFLGIESTPCRPTFACCHYAKNVFFGNFEFANINKQLGPNEMTEYIDIADVKKHKPYTLKVEILPPNPAPFYSMKVWIDSNGDGIFDPKKEEVASTARCEEIRHLFQEFIIIPKKLPDHCLMRIVIIDGMDWCRDAPNSPPIPCEVGNREGIYADIILRTKKD